MRFSLLLFCLPLFASPGYHEPWGRDAQLLTHSVDIPPPRKDPFSWVAEKIINFHVNVISPVDGPRSNFRPTSSRYMQLAIRRHGFIKGFVMGCDRLLRENSDDWVYRQRVIGGTKYKWDPTY